MLRRTLMMFMVTALAALPLMPGAQPMGPIPEGRTSEGYLIPEGAEPRSPSAEAVPGQNMVLEAQKALRDAGFAPGEIDGVMGPRTRAALRQFQASQGLAQTGTLDAPTQRQLMTEHTPESSGRRGVGFGR